MRLTVLVKGGEEELFVKTPLVINEASTILLKSATIYWNYNNIEVDENFISVKGDRVVFEPGYWTFKSIKNKLEGKGVNITEERETGKCVVKTDEQTYFKTIGWMLGFEKYTILQAGSTTKSPNMVNINCGLKSVDVSCSIVDTTKNIDQTGNYSNVIANIPIPTDKSLMGTLSHHTIDSKVSINKGSYNFLKFNVGSNVDGRSVGDVLLEMYITSK